MSDASTQVNQEEHDNNAAAEVRRSLKSSRGKGKRSPPPTPERDKGQAVRKTRTATASEPRAQDLEKEQAELERLRRDVTDIVVNKPNAWMLQTGGAAELDSEQLLSAQRSFGKWNKRGKNREAHDFEDYVAFVQEKWEEKLDRLGGIEAIEASLQEFARDMEATSLGDADWHGSGTPSDDWTQPAHESELAFEESARPGVEFRDRIVEQQAELHGQGDGAVRENPIPQPARGSLTPDDVRHAAMARIDNILRVTRETRIRDTETYRAKLLPEYPRDSPRSELLASAVAVHRRTALPPQHAAAFDRAAAQIHQEVVNNPLWIAADYLDRHTKLERIDYGLLTDERVQKAQQVYRTVSAEVMAAKRAQETHQALPPWRRALANKITGKEKRLHDQRLRASKDMLLAKQTLEAARQACQREIELGVANRNATALRQQEEARSERDLLEQGMRDALLERLRVEHSLEQKAAALELKHAMPNEVLEYAGARRLGPFEFQEFHGANNQLYIADATAMRDASSELQLARGDTVRNIRDQRGLGFLALEARGDTWPRGQAIEGRVLEIERSGQAVSALRVLDTTLGQDRWVRPSYGSDLRHDFPDAALLKLCVDDIVRVEGSSLQLRREHNQELRR